MRDFYEIIDCFKQGVFETDCKEMVLTQNTVGGARFEGQGYIRQSKGGALHFKIYVSKRENADPARNIDEWFRRASGKLHADEQFYDLVAVGRDERQWAARRILPEPHWDLTDGHVLITGPISILTACEPSSHPHPYLRIHFFDEYDVPLNRMTETELHQKKYMVRDRAEFEALGLKFEVRKRDSDTIIEVHSEKNVPVTFYLRVQESLQYLSGKTVNWRARIEANGQNICLELASPLRKSVRTQFNPPISPASIDFHESGWKLFECFLAYVITNANSTYWNPVAYHLHNACEATANSIDAWAVGYSVAVEAVAGLVVFEQDGQKAERVTEFQRRMRHCLASQMDFADMVPRMEGLMSLSGILCEGS